MSHYTIGELAKQSKVTIRTLQYYDRRGLLIAHRQTDSNRRYYTDEHVKQLELILVLKQLGCTLDEIKTLLDEDTNMNTFKTLLSLRKDALHSKVEVYSHTLKQIEKVEHMKMLGKNYDLSKFNYDEKLQVLNDKLASVLQKARELIQNSRQHKQC